MSYAGTARYKRNCWMRGNGAYSVRGELKRGISMRKKEGQEISTKEIGVDTAQYLMIVDGQSDTIHTGGDGYWGHSKTKNTSKKKTSEQ